MTDTVTPQPTEPEGSVILERDGPPAAGDLKAGYKTTEFWMAVAMFLVGLYLMSKGKDELGMGLITVSGLGYKATRTVQKREPRRIA